MTFPIYVKTKIHVPNHQPVYIMIQSLETMFQTISDHKTLNIQKFCQTLWPFEIAVENPNF
jgi:hypothetical protein